MAIKKTVFALIFFWSFPGITADSMLIDFDRSMGKNDPFFGNYYRLLGKQLKLPKSKWFKGMGSVESPFRIYSFLRTNYNQYKNESFEHKTERIPRIFHQIWVGPHPFPEKYKRWQKTWQNIPGWQYKLWTDKEVENYPLINKDAYYKEKNLGARADILRLEILYNEGGVYVDTDFECIKPELFSYLNNTFDFYCGLHPLDCKAILINNAIIGSIPGHPILKACIETLPHVGNGNTHYTTHVMERGPGLLSAMTLKYMNRGYKDMVFPATFFYPLGVLQMQKEPYSYLPFNDQTLERVKKDVIKPETIAIHWWDGSWGTPAAILRKPHF